MNIPEIKRQLADHIRTVELVSEKMAPEIDRCCAILVSALQMGKKILIMGNGGSAADAQHMAAEFVGRFLLERKALPAIALTTDTSIIRTGGNDYGFDQIFKRQIEALAQPGDVVVGISTSGYSSNVLHALITAKEMGCKTIGLLGKDGGSILEVSDVNLTVPVKETPRIQEAHMIIIHIICDLAEKVICDQT